MASDPDNWEKRFLLDSLGWHHERIRNALRYNKTVGMVTWDTAGAEMLTPVEYQYKFLRKVQTALALLRTDCTDEWLLCGPFTFAAVRLMPAFEEHKPEIALGLTYIGRLCRMRVYVDPAPEVKSSQFWVGHGHNFCIGVCLGVDVVEAQEVMEDDTMEDVENVFEPLEDYGDLYPKLEKDVL